MELGSSEGAFSGEDRTTQQYIVGELSSLLAGLQPTAGRLGELVSGLRREIEASPLGGLPKLAREALDLTDRVCWLALEEGDVTSFRRSAGAAEALWEFAASANLLR